MSVDYWSIFGYGIELSDIIKYIDKNKVITELKKLVHDTEIPDDTDDIFELDALCGYPYNYFAEFLCDLDERNVLTWDSDGDGNEYLMYTPNYPWYTEYTPQSPQEVAKIITEVLDKVCSMPDNMKYPIGYIDTIGYG